MAPVKKQRYSTAKNSLRCKKGNVVKSEKFRKIRKCFMCTNELLPLTKAGAQFIVQLIDRAHAPNEASLEARKLNSAIPRLVID